MNKKDPVMPRDDRTVEAIARQIEAKLQPKNDNFKYYCFVAYKLTEAEIWQNVEKAQNKGKDPARYFTYLCKRMIAEKDNNANNVIK
jgi:hypothetical protein